ncbi:MAG TPA: hypothetical protein VNK04_26590 [Gemmataceae bacterium]|jgi:hypothetical protein|nr:hypothetical protein [Gemmataceae bacterium]
MNRALLLLGFVALLVVGCGSSPPTYDAKTIEAANQFGKVAAAYKEAYQKIRRPPTADDLKPFLKKYGDPDALLTSPLDGKPLVIVPGPPPDAPPAEGEQPIIAYEQTGVNGRRMTVDSRGTVVFFSDAEFAKIKFAGGHKPAER